MSAKMNHRNIGNPAIDVPETAKEMHLPNANFTQFWAKRGQEPTNWNARFGKGFNKRKPSKC